MNVRTAPADGVADLITRLANSACQQNVLVLGALNVDTILYVRTFPEIDSAIVVDDLERLPGGHAGNCAAALAVLGVNVRIIAAVGDDTDGRLLIADLVQAGVDVSKIRILSDAPTGQVYIPTSGSKHYMLLARGANDRLTVNVVEEVTASRATAVVLFDPPRDVLLQVERLSQLAIDRPTIYWCPGPINAGNEELVSALLEHTDVLVVNEVEGAAIECAIGALRCSEVVTTHGARGASLVAGRERYSVPGHVVDVVDSIGSGDAFIAAYCVSKQAGLLRSVSLSLANGSGALAATSAGARGCLATTRSLVDFVYGGGS
ncbi:MAG: carbohydrate kinase family protein [Rhodanobacter sp.]